MEKIEIKDYVLESELGSGGMGTVYLGRNTLTDKHIAIKALKAEVAQPAMIERFKREGEALRDLNHPNIVKMLDTFEHNGQQYLVMEYVSGGDLSDLLGQGRLPIERVLRFSIDLADALTRAHKLDIIHRDLKPANVLIGDDGTLRLTDFGVAHMGSKERVTNTDAIVGTIDYLPPEAFGNEPFDARGDIWAFGVILFEMLGGKRPFEGASVIQVIRNITAEPIPDLEELRPDLPVDLVDLVYRMLERDPNARISSVRHVGALLEDIRKGRSSIKAEPGRFDTPIADPRIRTMHNLPVQVTPFIGRESELAELAKLLEDPQVRLMTILAPGGMGKTRLALEIAGRFVTGHVGNGDGRTPRQSLFADGAFFVELAPLAAASAIIPAIATAIGYSFLDDARDHKQQVLDFLLNKQMLLVLDNYEHIMEGAGLVTEILSAAPQMQILATSRQRLGQPGEMLFHLGGMEFPDWETPDDALEYAAVQLFMNSAQRAHPGWELTLNNLDSVARICRLVQGMPLGIVLSAAWLAMLSAEEIAVELEQSIDILTDELGELPERQGSIRAVMDYSWQMMSEIEQDVFMKLAVFRKGFTREAAQAVAGANLRSLMGLVNKSLIRRDTDSGRYEIHELLRQYAQEKLQAAAASSAIHDQHAAFYSQLLAQQLPLLKGGGQVAAIEQITAEYENCNAAWGWAVQQKQQAVVDAMVDSLYLYCFFHHWPDVGKVLFEQARKQWPANVAAAPLIAAQVSARFPGTNDIQAQIGILEQALAIAKQHNDLSEIAFCKRELGLAVGHRSAHDDPIIQRGLATLEDALALYRSLGDQYYEAHLLDDIGWCYFRLGDRQVRKEYSQQSIALRKQVGDLIGLGPALNGFVIMIRNDDPQLALQLTQELYNIGLQTKSRLVMIEARAMLGLYTYTIGDLVQTWDIFEEIYALANEVNHEFGIILSQLLMAQVICLQGGDYEKAKDLIDKALPDDAKMFTDSAYFINGVLAYALYYASIRDYAQLEIRVHMIFEAAARYWGETDPSPETVALFPFAAMVLACHGQQERAAILVEVAFASEKGFNQGYREWPTLSEFRADLRQELGEALYNTACEQGKSMDFRVVFRELISEFGGG